MNILHLTFSHECNDEVMHLCTSNGMNMSYLYYDDGTRSKYNISRDKALGYYQKHKDYLESFDAIVVSETTAISRVFLENNYSKLLLIWVHNRFDYYDAASNDCGFPDPGYYELMRKAHTDMPNVRFAFSTQFEKVYMEDKLGIPCPGPIIKPTGFLYTYPLRTRLHADTYFIGDFHNVTNMINLKEELTEAGLKAHQERISDPRKLRHYKGLVHIPNSWTSILLFRCIFMNVPIYLPTKRFLFELRNKNRRNFFWHPPFAEDKIEMSEWYNTNMAKYFIYFDSFEELRKKENPVTLFKNILS